MSVSLYVLGFMPPDERWHKNKAVWDACRAAGIDPPSEIEKFFGGEYPGDKPGLEIHLSGLYRKEIHPCCKEYKAEMRDGYEIDISKLPPEIKVLRFVASY